MLGERRHVRLMVFTILMGLIKRLKLKVKRRIMRGYHQEMGGKEPRIAKYSKTRNEVLVTEQTNATVNRITSCGTRKYEVVFVNGECKQRSY